MSMIPRLVAKYYIGIYRSVLYTSKEAYIRNRTLKGKVWLRYAPYLPHPVSNLAAVSLLHGGLGCLNFQG